MILRERCNDLLLAEPEAMTYAMQGLGFTLEYSYS